MTGRGAGYCGGNQATGSEVTEQQESGGRGRGGGGRRRGWRNMFHATGLTGWQRTVTDEQASDEPVAPSPKPSIPTAHGEQEEATTLKDEVTDLVRTLEDIQTRLAKLERHTEESPRAELVDN